MSKGLPIVSIVGRANVGKSSVFNRLLEQRRAIVADVPGTTRDSVMEKTEINGKPLLLVDTAGLKSPENDLELSIKEQIEQATDASKLILVTVEANIEPTEEDRRVAKLALKTKTPVALVINKFDKAKHANLEAFKKLGIKNVVHVSSTQGTGIDELEQLITEVIPNAKKTDTEEIRIALLGRPNVGKSMLFNKMLNTKRAIVADVAGTTRDMNRAEVKVDGVLVQVMDTAGIRRSGKSSRGIEFYSALRTKAAIEESDVCILLVDAIEPGTKLDQKIAGMVKDSGKGLLIAINKWDLIEKDESTYDRFSRYLAHDFQFVNWAQLMPVSALEGKNIARMLRAALDIAKQRDRQFKTPDLNKWLKSVIAHHPPAGLKNTHPKLMYITQTGINPPSFTVFGHDTKFLHWSYKRYLEREFRENYELYGTAIRFSFKEGGGKQKLGGRS